MELMWIPELQRKTKKKGRNETKAKEQKKSQNNERFQPVKGTRHKVKHGVQVLLAAESLFYFI